MLLRQAHTHRQLHCCHAPHPNLRPDLACAAPLRSAVLLCALTTTAPQVPIALVTPQSLMHIYVNVAHTDGNARAFWSHIGMHKEEGTAHCEPWTISWHNVVSVAGPVLSTA